MKKNYKIIATIPSFLVIEMNEMYNYNPNPLR